MAIPVETPNEPAAAAMREFLGIIPTEDLPAASSVTGTEKIAALQGVTPVFLTPTQIAALGGGGYPNPLVATGPAIRSKLRHFDSSAVFGGSATSDEPLKTYTESGSTFAANTYTTGLDGQIGILACRTAATATLQRPTIDNAKYRALSVSGSPVKNIFAGRFRFQPTAASNAPSATNDYSFQFGFQPSGSSRLSSNSDFAAFNYYWDGSAAVFQTRRRAANGTIASDNLTLPTANAWVVLAVAISDGLVEFYRNGVLLSSHTTTVPTAALAENLLINQTTAANINGFDCDWLADTTIGLPG